MAKRPAITTTSGMPIADNQNSLTAGPRGPLLMQGTGVGTSRSVMTS